MLACGDVRGNFSQLFTRVEAIQKKAGAFDMLLCVGDFFASDDDEEWTKVVSGEIKVPITTFVLGPNNVDQKRYYTDPSGCELHENITYLGRRGVYTTSSGLTIAYLSGVDGCAVPADSGDVKGMQFTPSDVDILCLPMITDAKFKGVDILLTSQWPRDVDKFSGVKASMVTSEGSPLIAQLALTLKPRYHFAGMEPVAYERHPYRNHKVLVGPSQHVTRFIGLAAVGNKQKQKYNYAFNIIPMKFMDGVELIKQPEDTTECPFSTDRSLFKTAANDATAKGEKPAQFFYDSNVLERGTTNSNNGRRRKSEYSNDGPHHKKVSDPTGCWFCLASPSVEKHLVVSIGEQCYLAMAKGGLTPDHILITTIGHFSSMTSAPVEAIAEVAQYKAALKKCYQGRDMSMVYFERNYNTRHLTIQAVAIPNEISSAELKQAFVEYAIKQDVEFAELPKHSDLKQIVPAGAFYFYVELPDATKLLIRIKDKSHFSLQFGREVLAQETILNMPGKADWRSIVYTKEQEESIASSFREKFKAFDFTDT